MQQNVDTSKLKNVISVAEEELIKLESNNNATSRKYKRIVKALEKGYALLNTKTYSQKEVDKKTDDIWEALNDDSVLPFIWFFLFGFLLSAALIFTTYQAYSFLEANWDHDHHHKLPELNENLSKLVAVNYKETNMVNLKNLFTVSDEEGLKNTPQEFQISNDGHRIPNVKYEVKYSVNIVELNGSHSKILDKKYIKYRLSYKDKNGNEIVGPIGTFADLKRNPDGSYLLMTGKQVKNGATDFKVIIWLSATAGNDQQGCSYTFYFNVNAAIAKI